MSKTVDTMKGPIWDFAYMLTYNSALLTTVSQDILTELADLSQVCRMCFPSSCGICPLCLASLQIGSKAATSCSMSVGKASHLKGRETKMPHLDMETFSMHQIHTNCKSTNTNWRLYIMESYYWYYQYQSNNFKNRTCLTTFKMIFPLVTVSDDTWMIVIKSSSTLGTTLLISFLAFL